MVLRMCRAIQFDHKAGITAQKIDCERSDRVLAMEFVVLETATTQA